MHVRSVWAGKNDRVDVFHHELRNIGVDVGLCKAGSDSKESDSGHVEIECWTTKRMDAGSVMKGLVC